MSALLDLAERCEAATGPDRDLDERIGIAIGLKNTVRVGHECLGNDRIVPVRCPSYTASLDAAMTLVPEGHLYTLKTLWDGPQICGYANVRQYKDVSNDHSACDNKRYVREDCGLAPTPALALTAAALRARAAKDQAA